MRLLNYMLATNFDKRFVRLPRARATDFDKRATPCFLRATAYNDNSELRDREDRHKQRDRGDRHKQRDREDRHKQRDSVDRAH